jgi:hypothetical protein
VRYCWIGREEVLASEGTSGEVRGSWREEKGTYDRWQMDEASWVRCRARADEVEERRQGPWEIGGEVRAYLGAVLDGVDHHEA